MLSLAEIRSKAEAMDRLASEASEPDATAFRDLALQWRLLEVQAVFMNAMDQSAVSEPPPPADA